MNIIFFGVNGVLNTDATVVKTTSGKKFIEDELVNRLVAAIEESGAEPVIASSWSWGTGMDVRLGAEYKNLLDTLAAAGVRVYDSIKMDSITPAGKAIGIGKWLKDHRNEVDEYIIFDYDCETWREFLGLSRNLIPVNPNEGLSEQNVDAAVFRLTGHKRVKKPVEKKVEVPEFKEKDPELIEIKPVEKPAVDDTKVVEHVVGPTGDPVGVLTIAREEPEAEKVEYVEPSPEPVVKEKHIIEVSRAEDSEVMTNTTTAVIDKAFRKLVSEARYEKASRILEEDFTGVSDTGVRRELRNLLYDEVFSDDFNNENMDKVRLLLVELS